MEDNSEEAATYVQWREREKESPPLQKENFCRGNYMREKMVAPHMQNKGTFLKIEKNVLLQKKSYYSTFKS